jgi:hypothetical protein
MREVTFNTNGEAWLRPYRSYKSKISIYAEVETRVAGSLEAGGLPGYHKVLFVEINVMKSWQSFVALYFSQILKMWGFKLYMNNLYMFYLTREKNDMSVQVEGWRTSPS